MWLETMMVILCIWFLFISTFICVQFSLLVVSLSRAKTTAFMAPEVKSSLSTIPTNTIGIWKSKMVRYTTNSYTGVLLITKAIYTISSSLNLIIYSNSTFSNSFTYIQISMMNIMDIHWFTRQSCSQSVHHHQTKNWLWVHCILYPVKRVCWRIGNRSKVNKTLSEAVQSKMKLLISIVIIKMMNHACLDATYWVLLILTCTITGTHTFNVIHVWLLILSIMVPYNFIFRIQKSKQYLFMRGKMLHARYTKG